MKKETYILPFLALQRITVVPGMVIHFDVNRKKSMNAIEEIMSDTSQGQNMYVATQKNNQTTEPHMADMYEIGTIVEIKQVIKLPNAVMRVVVEGIQKARTKELLTRGDILYAKVESIPDDPVVPGRLESKAMCSNLHELVKLYAIANPMVSRDVLNQLFSVEDIKTLLANILSDFPMDYRDRQHLLEISEISTQFEETARIIAEMTEILRIKEELGQKVSAKVNKNQKDYVMHEQMKAIQEELGENDTDLDAQEYLNRTEQLVASQEVKEKLQKEIRRYKVLSAGSSESNVVRGYIETLLELPWDKQSQDNQDIKRAKEILDKDHYGLHKVKERILEYLAVRTYAGGGSTPVICLVGPPGTGKTSIAKSVARALDREYVRVCLGGVRDEAEIRGHRKTYVGAMPGRMIDALRRAKVKNPVILLDEIDKLSKDYRSDTASALLEVLDSEQNIHFRDHYVELPTDLSQVLFIATANDISEMSRPLLDRMEIIEINSYTVNEKMHIAKEYLIPKQCETAGLARNAVKITDSALLSMIEHYTREAGVRNLERQIMHVCRKAVTEFLEDHQPTDRFVPVKVSGRNLEYYLGKRKYMKDTINRKAQTGIVRGLAWTSVGGDTLQIEVNIMPGKGNLILTGQMGNVMQESAKIALSYVRTLAGKDYIVSENYFETHDFHLHIPEGAVKKDGPSAGITMATALLSAVSGKRVDNNAAMTGEITLRGEVLAVGGLKEKLLAANIAGVKIVFVPLDNKADIEELNEEIIGDMTIVYVAKMRQVIEKIFVA